MVCRSGALCLQVANQKTVKCWPRGQGVSGGCDHDRTQPSLTGFFLAVYASWSFATLQLEWKVPRKPTMSVFVVREVQDGRQGEPAITRERRHFRKIHESHCKPWSCLACSYLNWLVEVIADLCSRVDRMSDKASTVNLAHARRGLMNERMTKQVP